MAIARSTASLRDAAVGCCVDMIDASVNLAASTRDLDRTAGNSDRPDVTTQAERTDPPSTDRPIFFLHIPKTGGNTVNSYFFSFLPIETVFPRPPQLTLEADDFAEARRLFEGLRYIHGHVSCNLMAELPVDRMRLITFVRDPISRLVSHYLYLREQPKLPRHAVAMALRIDDFVRTVPGFLPDPQARTVAIAFGIPGSDRATSESVFEKGISSGGEA